MVREKFAQLSKSFKILSTLLQKKHFFEEWSWFKFNNLGVTLCTGFKFYISVAKGLKPKFKKFCGLIEVVEVTSRFVEVTGRN